MTAAAWAFLAMAGVFAAADWWAVARARMVLEYVAKPATLAALIGVALTLDPVHANTRVWFAAALALSLAGDVFLMLPGELFVAGLSSFLLAHVAYVIGFALHGGPAWALAAAAVPVVLVAALVARRVLRAALSAGHRGLVAPLVVYIVVIAAMVTSALATGNPRAGVGAVLFMTSDALIAEDRFVRSRPSARVVIIVTYHLGQAGLVLSLL